MLMFAMLVTFLAALTKCLPKQLKKGSVCGSQFKGTDCHGGESTVFVWLQL